MPELPEVDALAAFLRETALDRVVDRVEPVAVSALKTFDPPPSALRGAALAAVERHGKFLDLVFALPTGERLDLVTHLARAGWLRWKPNQPAAPARPGRGPLALRLTFTDRSGFDLTEAGTQKRLAVYVVRDPAEVPGIARLGVDPLGAAFTVAALKEILAAAGRAQLKGATGGSSSRCWVTRGCPRSSWSMGTGSSGSVPSLWRPRLRRTAASCWWSTRPRSMTIWSVT
jgi:formamidopyrimidine-DNA glycosylase